MSNLLSVITIVLNRIIYAWICITRSFLGMMKETWKLHEIFITHSLVWFYARPCTCIVAFYMKLTIHMVIEFYQAIHALVLSLLCPSYPARWRRSPYGNLLRILPIPGLTWFGETAIWGLSGANKIYLHNLFSNPINKFLCVKSRTFLWDCRLLCSSHASCAI